MASLGYEFNPDGVEPRENLDPVPAGVYAAEVVESDVVDSKSGRGRQVKLTLRIIDGPLEGRRIWDNINFRHESEITQRIGQQQLAELCAACGHRGPLDDTELLHGIPIRVRVEIRKDDTGNYGPRNAVKRYMPLDASIPDRKEFAAQTTERPTAAKPASGGNMPWRR